MWFSFFCGKNAWYEILGWLDCAHANINNFQEYGIVAIGCAMPYLYVGQEILPVLFNFLDYMNMKY